MSIEFVEGSIGQLEEIVRVNGIIFQGMYRYEPYSLSDYQRKLSDKKPIIYLASDEGTIIGDSVSFEKEGYFYIWILGTLKEYRGQGIATKLLELNEEYARRNKFKQITTKVYDVSIEMQNLLTKRGYQVIEEHKSERNEKYAVFQLKLV